MQIKEFEAYTLKECLQQVRNAMGADAVILETRKFRKGGLMGLGAKDAVCIVAAVGITVQSDLAKGQVTSKQPRTEETPSVSNHREAARSQENLAASSAMTASKPTAASIAARSAYGRSTSSREDNREAPQSRIAAVAEATRAISHPEAKQEPVSEQQREADLLLKMANARAKRESQIESRPAATQKPPAQVTAKAPQPASKSDSERFTFLERAMGEIRECLLSLQKEQRESNERTVSAVVSAVAPAVSAVSAAGLVASADEALPPFPEIYNRMIESGVSEALVQELFEQLPDMSAWSEQAQEPLAVSALKDMIARRVSSRGAIELTPGRLKAVALIGPTGVGKTTTIAKLAAHFALMQGKKVALLTVDTYRIAAVEQLKTYSQIIDLPVAVAYSNAEVLPVLEKFADFDLILIDTAGRSQKNIMQVGELKTLLETVKCETHLVLSAQIKESDMVDAARRFSAARVDRLIFSKLDETSSYGTLLNVADRTGIPLSYLTTGQKVPEDIEVADGGKLAGLILE